MRSLVSCVLCVAIVLAFPLVVGPAAADTDLGWGVANALAIPERGDSYGPQLAANAAGRVVALWTQDLWTRSEIWASDPFYGTQWNASTALETGPYYASDPCVAMDSGGNATAVYLDYDWLGISSVYASRRVAGMEWGRPVPLENATGYTNFPSVAVNSAGDAMAVWGQYNGTAYHVFSNHFTPSGGWEGATLIDDDPMDASEISVALDNTGNATAVYLKSNGMVNHVYASRYVPGTGWLADERIDADDNNTQMEGVGVDASGNVIATWLQWIGPAWNALANRFVPGVGWEAPTIISSAPTWFGTIRLEVSSGGTAFAIWNEWDGFAMNIVASRYVPGVGWEIPASLEANVGYAYNADVAVDGSGRATAVWVQNDGVDYSIYANRYVVGTGWGAAVPIEGDSGTADEPDVAVDGANHAFAVWQAYDGARWHIRGNAYNTDWGGWIWTSSEVEYENAGDALPPVVAANRAGVAFAVWAQYDTPYLSDICASRYMPGEGWGAPTLIEFQNFGSAINPRVAVDEAGNAIAVWFQYDGTDNVIYANRYAAGSGWGRPVAIGRGDAPDVAVDRAGDAMAVWRQWDAGTLRVFASRFVPGVGWDAATPIDVGLQMAGLPVVAMDGAGNALAVWDEGDSRTNDVYANYYQVLGGGWGTPTLIESNPYNNVLPKVAMNDAGRAFALWTVEDGLSRTVHMNDFTPLGATWGTEIPLSAMPGEMQGADLGVDDAGNAIATWSHWDGLQWTPFARSWIAGTGLGPTTALRGSVGDASSTAVAVDPAGDATAVWMQWNGTTYRIWGDRYDAQTGWGEATWIQSGPVEVGPPDVAMDGAGNGIAVWDEGLSYHHLPMTNRYTARDGAPSLSLTSPTAALTNDPGVTVAGMTDPGASVTIDGSPEAVAFDGAFARMVVLPDGPHTFVVVATNLAGNTRTATATIMVDTKPPVLAVTSPLDGTLTNRESIRVIGTTEPGARLVVNGIATGVNGTGGFGVDVPLAEGSNPITATATDAAGNPATTTITVRRDTVPPALLLTSPSADITNNPSVTVAGTTEPGAAVTVDGTPVAVGPGGAFTRTVTLPQGAHTFVVVASDPAMNSATARATITVDTAAPALVITSPADGARLNTAHVTVSGMTEPGVRLAVNGQDVAVDGTGSFSVTLSLSDGPHTILAEARDAAGNPATDSVAVTIDTTPPPLGLTSPADPTLTRIRDVLVSGSTEPGATVTIDGTPVTVAPDGSFSRTVTLAEGVHTFNVVATDAAGNTNRASATVTVDLTPPALTLTAPANGATVDVPTITVSGTTEAGARLVVNGVLVSVGSTGAFSFQLALASGANTITATATDAAGNAATASVAVTYTNPIPGLQAQLQATQNALNAANAALSTTRDQLNTTRNELATTRNELTATRSDLANTTAALDSTNANLAGIGTQMLLLLVLLVVVIVITALQFVMGRRQHAPARREEPAEEEEEEEVEEPKKRL